MKEYRPFLLPQLCLDMGRSVTDWLAGLQVAGTSHDRGGILDPVDGEVAGEHYSASHFAWAQAMLYVREGGESRLHTALEAMRFHRRTSADEYAPPADAYEEGEVPRPRWDYHWDFNNLAFLCAYELLSPSMSSQERRECQRTILTWRTNGHYAVNWVAMRSVAALRRYDLARRELSDCGHSVGSACVDAGRDSDRDPVRELPRTPESAAPERPISGREEGDVSVFRAIRDREEAGVWLRYVLDSQVPDGGLEDVRGRSLPSQYHAYTACLLDMLARTMRREECVNGGTAEAAARNRQGDAAGGDVGGSPAQPEQPDLPSPAAVEKAVVRAARWLLALCGPDGEMNALGRGQGQIFGYACAVYLFCAAMRRDPARAAEYRWAAESVAFRLRSCQRPNGDFPLVLHDVVSRRQETAEESRGAIGSTDGTSSTGGVIDGITGDPLGGPLDDPSVNISDHAGNTAYVESAQDLPDAMRAGWYDYHHATVYNAFAAVWLLKAAALFSCGDTAAMPPARPPQPGVVYLASSGLLSVRGPSFFALFSAGHEGAGYATEAGITPHALMSRSGEGADRAVFRHPLGPGTGKYGAQCLHAGQESNIWAPLFAVSGLDGKGEDAGGALWHAPSGVRGSLQQVSGADIIPYDIVLADDSFAEDSGWPGPQVWRLRSVAHGAEWVRLLHITAHGMEARDTLRLPLTALAACAPKGADSDGGEQTDRGNREADLTRYRVRVRGVNVAVPEDTQCANGVLYVPGGVVHVGMGDALGQLAHSVPLRECGRVIAANGVVRIFACEFSCELSRGDIDPETLPDGVTVEAETLVIHSRWRFRTGPATPERGDTSACGRHSGAENALDSTDVPDNEPGGVAEEERVTELSAMPTRFSPRSVSGIVALSWDSWSGLWKRKQRLLHGLWERHGVPVAYVEPPLRGTDALGAVAHAAAASITRFFRMRGRRPLSSMAEELGRMPHRARRSLSPGTWWRGEPIGTGCTLHTPLLPLPGARTWPVLNTLNRRWWLAHITRLTRRQEFSGGYVLWLYHPSQWEALEVCGPDAELVVYDWTDDWAAALPASFGEDRRAELEARQRAILRRADVVFAVSGELVRRAREHCPWVYYLPNGTDMELFRPAPDSAHGAADGVKLAVRGEYGNTGTGETSPTRDVAPGVAEQEEPRPTILYLSQITERLDVPLLVNVARRCPDWSFVLVGPVVCDPGFVAPLREISNVRLAGAMPREAAARAVAEASVCILPHRVDALTATLDPIKLYDYLATGVPVVSTGVAMHPDLRRHVRVADTEEAFVRALQDALEESVAQRLVRREAVRRHSWTERVDEAMRILERHLGGQTWK